MELVKFVVLLLGLQLASLAVAQSPREHLQQMVEQLQKSPNDNTLRQRIIKLGADIKPAPAIGETAERHLCARPRSVQVGEGIRCSRTPLTRSTSQV